MYWSEGQAQHDNTTTAIFGGYIVPQNDALKFWSEGVPALLLADNQILSINNVFG